MPLIALLVTPLLACFLGGAVAAAARTAQPPAAPPEWPDNVIRFDPRRRLAR